METTTMTCTSEKGDLLKLDRKKLTEFTAAHPETGKKLNSVLSADLIDYLKKIPFLENLPNSKLVSLCECVFVLCMYRTHICGYACVYVRVCVVYYVNIYIYIYIYIYTYIYMCMYIISTSRGLACAFVCMLRVREGVTEPLSWWRAGGTEKGRERDGKRQSGRDNRKGTIRLYTRFSPVHIPLLYTHTIPLLYISLFYSHPILRMVIPIPHLYTSYSSPVHIPLSCIFLSSSFA
jgi:hypothetical protein